MILSKISSSLLLCFVFLAACNSKTETRQADSLVHTIASDPQHFLNHLPAPTSWTNDYEGIFKASEKQALDSLAAVFEKDSMVQFCIVTLDSTRISKEKFDEQALYIAKSWGVGLKDKNNGILICISKEYRRIRICTGLGIAPILPDEKTASIINDVILPKFKTENYFEGTLDGMNAIMDTLKKEMQLKQ